MNLIPYSTAAAALLSKDEEFIQRLVNFVNVLDAEPTTAEVKQRGFDGVLYVPIEIVESKLNHFFYGLWETYEFKYTVVVNELVGDLVLSVLHPESGIWLRRVGTGAVLIQQRVEYEDGEKKSADVTDVSRKIPNALETAMGHLKAECIKNAAKSLGKTFGGMLMRQVENESIKNNKELVTLESFIETINAMDDKESIVLYYKELHSSQRSDKRFQNECKRREMEIASKKEHDEGPVL